MSKLRCVVVGGSGAIGSSIAVALSEAGATLGFTYHKNEAKSLELEKHLPGSVRVFCDLRKMASISEAADHLVSKLGGVDCVIFAAGSPAGDLLKKSADSFESFLNIQPENLNNVMQVNALGPFRFCQVALTSMGLNPEGGNIIFIGSLDGVKPLPSPVHMAASRGAVKGMVESLSKEFGVKKICVNQVVLGLLDEGASLSLSKGLRNDFLKYSAMERFGSCSEVAQFVAWFAAHNTYVTGQSLVLDGGL